MVSVKKLTAAIRVVGMSFHSSMDPIATAAVVMFKAGTDDLRDSPALAVAAERARRGAHLTTSSPEVPAHTDCGVSGLDVVGEPLQAAAGVHAIIVLTEWPQFRDIDCGELASVASRACCVDTRNLQDEKQLVNAGFCYHRLGSGQRSRSA